MVAHSSRTLRVAAVAVVTALALSACSKGDDSAKQAGRGGHEAPAPVVGVVTVHPQQVVFSADLPGRLESYRSANVRAQVGGIIKKRLFQEGGYVRAGQALYQLDDAVYIANLESARAQLASAQASLAKADADLSRYKPLVEADAISKQEYDSAVSTKRSADALVKSTNAAVKSAQINVNYSRISAPISGYIGQSKVSEGALVSANDPTVLANIQQTNPMYVNLTQSANDVMQLRQNIADGKMKAVGGAVEVGIKLENGKEYGHKGRLLFADPTVDEATGQVTLRAEVPNPDNVLLPGLYVRVSLPQADIPNAFVVPQQAVTRGARDTVLIVNAEGGMEPRVVKVEQQRGSDWIISGGLKDGDRVIVEGIMIAGMMGAKKVTPKEWTPGGTPAGTPAGTPGAAQAGTTAAQNAAAPAQKAPESKTAAPAEKQ